MLLFLKNLLFTLLVPGTVAVYVPVFLISHPAFELRAVAVTGVPLLLAGSAIYLWCLWDFGSRGRGTPLPLDPPKNLVVRGLYRYTRNPMYIGVLSTIFGWALFFSSTGIAIYGICAALFFHAIVLVVEEPVLKHTFGAAYDKYCAKVNRWLPGRGAI